jgi:hypothetical protein
LNRVPVQSTNIKSVGHDSRTLTLEVEFHDGDIYQYFDVPQAVHAELLQSSSVGKFFGSQIKGQYRYAKL